MSAEFLLEIGTEELPASFVTHALRAMKENAVELVGQARLSTDSPEVHIMGTPRRLALRLRGLASSQPDRDETVMGPPWSAAFDADGSPKKAATGFARKHGVEYAKELYRNLGAPENRDLLGALLMFGASNRIIDRYEVQGEEAVGWDVNGTEVVRVPFTEPTRVREHYDARYDVYRHNTT